MTAEPATPGSTPAYSVTHNREAWLLRAVELMRPKLVEVYEDELPAFRVSIGFPPDVRSESGNVLGVTVAPEAVSDRVAEVYISPEDADTAKMLNTLLHNLVHVLVGTKQGHRGRFAEVATRLGFEGSMTDATPSTELGVDLLLWAAELGAYPGGQVNIPSRARRSTPRPVLVGADGQAVRITSGRARQGNRNVTIICPSCGFNGRTYSSWIAKGLPFCGTERTDGSGLPCMTRMIVK